SVVPCGPDFEPRAVGCAARGWGPCACVARRPTGPRAFANQGDVTGRTPVPGCGGRCGHVTSGRANGTSDRTLLLAIAGGHLETHCVLLDLDGHALASRSTRTASPQHVGFDESARVIGELVHATVAAAEVADARAVRRLVVFIAGADTPEDRRELEQRLAKFYPHAALTVDNDIHAILWAGLRRPSGVAVLADDGMNAIA